MEQEQGFIDYIEQSIIKNWDRNALTDYKGVTLQYKDVARKIAKFHIVLESAGIHDVLAKSKGSSNPHNLVKATIAALKGMRDARMVARQRNISLDKVFNG